VFRFFESKPKIARSSHCEFLKKGGTPKDAAKLRLLK